jgi:hypothetical protein
MSKKPTYEIIKVNPALAQSWLDTMVGNRTLKEDKVFQYARDMDEGRWHLSGQPVKFDTAGRLMDGQHRLVAVTLANCTVEMEVVRDINPAAMMSIDEGTPRSFSDILRIGGTDYAQLLSSSLAWSWKLWSGNLWSVSRRASRAELVELNKTMGPALKAILLSNPGLTASRASLKRKDYIPPTLRAALLFAFQKADPTKAEQFSQALDNWMKLPEDHPVAVLQLRLLSEASKGNRANRMSPTERVAAVIRAWNLFYKGRTARRIQPKSRLEGADAYPTIEGLDVRKWAPKIHPMFGQTAETAKRLDAIANGAHRARTESAAMGRLPASERLKLKAKRGAGKRTPAVVSG